MYTGVVTFQLRADPMQNKKIISFLLGCSLLLGIRLAAAVDNPLVTQFNAYNHDFKQNQFTLEKAQNFHAFLQAHGNELAELVKEKGAPPSFKFPQECNGTLNLIQDLNQQQAQHAFDWTDMWNAPSPAQEEVFMMSEAMSMMYYELNGNS